MVCALGNAYDARMYGSRADSQERAIACFNEVLLVWTRDADPSRWADMQLILGVEYACRLRGDRTENQNRAIAYIRAAIEVSAQLLR